MDHRGDGWRSVGAIAVALAASPGSASPQPPNVDVDLSGAVVETVVPGTFDGGYFDRIGSVVVKANGLWATDLGHRTAFWFGHGGVLRQRYGQAGAGPGELGTLSDIVVDTLVTMVDAKQRRAVRFRIDGTHVDTRRLGGLADPGGPSLPLGRLRTLRGGFAVGSTVGRFAFSSENSRPYVHVVVFRPGYMAVDTVHTYHGAGGGWRHAQGAGVFLPPFGASGAWGVAGDSAIVLADGVRGTVTVLSAGNRGLDTVATLDLGRRGRKVDDAELKRVVQQLASERGLPRSVEVSAAPHWSVASELVLAPNGEVWLRQATHDDTNLWLVADVFAGRKRLATLPSDFRLEAVWGGRLYGVVEDALGVQEIGVVVWPTNAVPPASPGAPASPVPLAPPVPPVPSAPARSVGSAHPRRGHANSYPIQ